MKMTADGFLVCSVTTQNNKNKGIEKEVLCCCASCEQCPNFYQTEDRCQGCIDNLEFNNKGLSC